MGYQMSMYYVFLKKSPNNKGSVLILTVIISTILFSIGISLVSILEKEITRQRYADQSVVALNIANTAFECTLYNDFRRYAFDAHTRGETTHPFSCGTIYQVRTVGDWGVPYVLNPVAGSTVAVGTGRYEYVVVQVDRSTAMTVGTTPDLDDGVERPCARVVVQKQCLTPPPAGTTICPNGLIESYVEVRGYFSCTEGNETDRDLVRRFRVYY